MNFDKFKSIDFIEIINLKIKNVLQKKWSGLVHKLRLLNILQ